MAKLDFTVQARISELNATIKLPAMYDNLTQEQRAAVREEYHRRQKGICPFCLQPLLGDPPPVVMRMPLDPRMFGKNLEFLRFPIHLHHNHRTGLTIGAYHARCNAILAQYLGE